MKEADVSQLISSLRIELERVNRAILAFESKDWPERPGRQRPSVRRSLTIPKKESIPIYPF